MSSELVCPKCHGAMRSYERNGVNIDQCVACRGIFRDRGELEQLLDAEAAYNQASQPAPQTQPRGYGYQGGQSGHHGSTWAPGGHPQRRKSFLGELFALAPAADRDGGFRASTPFRRPGPSQPIVRPVPAR